MFLFGRDPIGYNAYLISVEYLLYYVFKILRQGKAFLRVPLLWGIRSKNHCEVC